MQLISFVRISLVNLVIMVCFAQVSNAQSAFPAFEPEEAVSESAAPVRAVSRFPTAEPVENIETITPVNQSMFPVENVSFPAEGGTAVTGAAGQVLTPESLGTLLREDMGLDASPFENRHDFLYKADLQNQELELFFSVALSTDQKQLRVRAWLDPLPEGMISEEPLLKLLNRNAELTAGLHYAYSREGRRFLIEAVLKNDQMTAEKLKTALNEVSMEVATSWGLWATSEWTTGPKRIAEKPELDSRSNAFSNDQFEMPLRR